MNQEPLIDDSMVTIDLRKDCGINNLMRLAKTNKLPTDFNDWGLSICTGWSVAHQAARWGNLPQNFNLWQLTDNNNNSVALITVRYSKLPYNFTEWYISRPDGWSVAHEAALYQALPKHFNLWCIKDKNGTSVLDVHLMQIEKKTIFTKLKYLFAKLKCILIENYK